MNKSRVFQGSYTDAHCHILPGIDDGPKTVEDSEKLAQKLISMGFARIIATPHYYFYKETADRFIRRRTEAFKSVNFPKGLSVLPSAEVALESGLTRACDLKKLAIPGTNKILIELPMKKYNQKISEELYSIKMYHGLYPVLAHIERYDRFFDDDGYNDILSAEGIVFQISAFSLASFRQRRLFMKLYKSGANIVLGTDAHRIDFRVQDSAKGIKKLSKMIDSNEFERIMNCDILGLA